MSENLKDKSVKKVFITGASSDIGLKLCKIFIMAGWHVIGHCRNYRKDFDEFPSCSFTSFEYDFENITLLQEVISSHTSMFSSIDSFINLAAEVRPVSFRDATLDDIIRAFSVNLIPGLFIMRAIAPGMLKRKFGRIVHASSIGVKFGGSRNNFVYSISKHSQEFIPSECRIWARDNVYVNCVRVGVTESKIHSIIPEKDLELRREMIPAKRLANPEEIARLVYWLGSECNGFTTSEVIAASGGE